MVDFYILQVYFLWHHFILRFITKLGQSIDALETKQGAINDVYSQGAVEGYSAEYPFCIKYRPVHFQGSSMSKDNGFLLEFIFNFSLYHMIYLSLFISCVGGVRMIPFSKARGSLDGTLQSEHEAARTLFSFHQNIINRMKSI